jgi:signal transduction histidine kinase/CheY-like chemotaxis protein/HPt (histidine-containing phosphotransfer) domain-containing protein
MHLYKQAAALRDYNEKEKEIQMQYNQMLRDYCPDDIFLLDTNLDILLCTSSVKKRVTKDVIGEPFIQIVKEAFCDDFADRLEKVLREVLLSKEKRTFDSQTYEHCRNTNEKREVFFSFQISPALNHDGELTGVVMLAHDNTEMHNANLLAEAGTRAKSNFLANMSHEMRTPLNAVIGLSELALDKNDISKELEDKLEKIHTSGITLLNLVNDILDLSKIESGKFEIIPVEYNISSLINDVVTLNIMRAEGELLKFNLIVNENLPRVIYGDDLRIKQIFNNLLSNAFKYTNAGTIEWNVSFEKEGNNIWIISSVKDSGIGIKSQDVQKLFHEYNQVDIKTNRKTEGTGLGLAITKHLLEMMNGSITVESEYGKGSIFSIRLPQKIASDDPIGIEAAENLMNFRHVISQRAQNAKFVRTNLSYAHVLVVDDVITNLDVAKGMIIPYEIKVDCATSGQQAIDMIRTEKVRYNAVFMDHMMPGMDGIEATRIIREEIGTDYARNIPIIALTANAIIGNKEMFLNKGFQAFITKPIDMLKLDSVIRQWVRDKEREKELFSINNCALLSENNDCLNEFEREHTFNKPLFSDIEIDGMDISEGLKYFNCNEKAFISVLRSYVANTPPLVNSMKENLTTQNLLDYAITVHGIKGSSFGISAQKIGKIAEELEIAAKAGDLEKVKARHGTFENIVEELLEGIRAALSEINAIAKVAATSPDPILLEELRKACEDYDMNRVDKAMSQLESFKYEYGEETIKWLREQIDNCSFEEIISGEWPSDNSEDIQQ